MDYAEAHQHWTVDDWKRVVWTDETKVNCLGSDGKRWVWKREGEGLNDRLVQGTVKFGGGSLMFLFVLVIVVIKHFEIGLVDIDLYIDFAVFRVFGQYFVNNFS